MKKITGRDIRFFLLDVLAMLTFVIIYDWEEFKRGIEDGYNGKPYQYEKTEATMAPASEVTE